MDKLKDFLIRYAEVETMNDKVLKVCYSGDGSGFEFVRQICDVEKFEGEPCETADLMLLVGPDASPECAWQAIGNKSVVVTARFSMAGSLQDNFSYVARIEDEDMNIYSNCKEAEICFKKADDLVVTTIPPEPQVIEHTPLNQWGVGVSETTLPPQAEEPPSSGFGSEGFGWKTEDKYEN